MEESIHRWLVFSSDRDDFEDEPAKYCYLGKIYYFSEGRNAWWGLWSETYPLEYAFGVLGPAMQKPTVAYSTQ
jgi:hypothetical protein